MIFCEKKILLGVYFCHYCYIKPFQNMDNEMIIIQNCQLGKFDAFWELYEKYVDEIYRFVYLKTYDSHKAEDITSEVFMKAINSINTFKITKGANFRAWLYRIAYNHIVDSYKKEKDLKSLEEYLEKWLEQDLGKEIDDKEKLKQVFTFLSEQKKEHKDIFIMRIWWGLSYIEISTITGKSVVSCKKTFSRTIALINANFVLLLLFVFILMK